MESVHRVDRREIPDEVAAAVPGFDEAENLQLLDRRADRDPADAEGRAEPVLGRQFLTDFPDALHQLRFQLHVDLRAQRLFLDAL